MKPFREMTEAEWQAFDAGVAWERARLEAILTDAGTAMTKGCMEEAKSPGEKELLIAGSIAAAGFLVTVKTGAWPASAGAEHEDLMAARRAHAQTQARRN